MIREYVKWHVDNLPIISASNIKLSSVAEERDLKFWTHTSTQPIYVDLTDFAIGRNSNRSKFVFSGRPNLIEELFPFIKSTLRSSRKVSVKSSVTILRKWFSLFDDVERELEKHGEPIQRLDSVAHLSAIHHALAYDSLDVGAFTWFVGLVNRVRASMGLMHLFWEGPKSSPIVRELPSQQETSELRNYLKKRWQTVRQHWSELDAIRDHCFTANTSEDQRLHTQWRILNEACLKYDTLVPSAKQLGEFRRTNEKHDPNFFALEIRREQCINAMEIDTAFHMCLAGTGLNPSVLYMLDATDVESWLYSHPTDPERYVLSGSKPRSAGRLQPIVGLWKTKFGSGYIINSVLKRTSPLREELKVRLKEARDLFEALSKSDASESRRLKQYKIVSSLESAIRCVWLYVCAHGRIRWANSQILYPAIDRSRSTYMISLILEINEARKKEGKRSIPHISPGDFRDVFSTYVWHQSGGNIFCVMRSLHHARLSTTQCYVENTLLNSERNVQVSKFMENLFDQLGGGSLDITKLAHLQRFGDMSPEMESRLVEIRKLQRSRLNIACKDPDNAPPNIQEGPAGKCRTHRCLLCEKNSIILPESLDGIAMRVEELIQIQATLPIESWFVSDFQLELDNANAALQLFEKLMVDQARAIWRDRIVKGLHLIPGLGSMCKP